MRAAPSDLSASRAIPRVLSWLLLSSLLAFLLMAATLPAAAAVNPPPVQVYYVPAPEDDVFAAMQGIFPGNVPFAITEPIKSYISISVIADGTRIYYDHWEDGFEIDLSNPTQGTTETWGDGNPANGAPPGIPGDILGPNTVIVLRDDVFLATRQTVVDFDGGDKFGASRTIAVTRAAWDSGASTLLAGALEVYPVDRWGTAFLAPAGVDSPSPALFEYTALVIMAADDDTLVQVDTDADGLFDDVVTLNEGESHLTTGTIREGARVQADAPVQVGLITGDINDTYEARWYVLFPEEQWSDSYYSPVSASAFNGTTAFLYNPHAAPLTVTRTSLGGATLDTLIQPSAGISVPLVAGSGARFASSDGRPFVAIAAVDSTDAFNSKGDWGFAMIPQDQLTMQTLIGWGAGRDPDSLVNPNENGSPVWVIPVNGGSAVTICVDYDGDNQGALTDANGFKYDLLLTLNPYQAAKVFDPDGDQTGMLLYVCTNTPNTPVTAKLAAAWGQDPDTASPGAPALDLGTTAPPASTFEAGKAAQLIVDVDGDGKADGGDTLRYAVIIRNASRVPIVGVSISDTVPLHTSYVLSSTTVDLGSGPVTQGDNAEGTPFPLDEGGIVLGDLPVNGVFTVTFDVLLDAPLPIEIDRVRNVAVVRAGDETRTPEVETPVDFDPTLALAKLTNALSAPTAPGVLIRVGEPVTWTYIVTNTGALTISTLTVTDSDPAVTPTLVTGDGGLPTIFDPGEVRIYAASGLAAAGQYSNTATAVGVGSDGDVVTQTAVSHYFGVVSGITVTKQPNATLVRGGDTVTYTYQVSSVSNVPLLAVSLTDDACAPVNAIVADGFNQGDTNQDNALDAGETWQYLCSIALTTTTTNVATAGAVDPLSATVTATATAVVTAVTPGIDLDKAVDRTSVLSGTSVVYTLTVRNTGTDDLTAVQLSDNQCSLGPISGDTGSDGILTPLEVWIATCTRVITQTTVNTATVTALDSFGAPLTDTASVKVVVPRLYLPIIITPRPEVPCPPPNGCPLANEIKAIAVNEGNGRLYVLTRNPDEVLLVDAPSTEILARVAAGTQPWGVAVNAAANLLYVSSFGDSSVRIYHANTLALLKTVVVGDNPSLIEHLPGTNTVFALVRGGSRVAIFEGQDLVQTINTGGSGPFGIAADAVNQRIFISHRDSQSLTMLRKVNGSWQAFLGPQFDDGRQLFEIAYAPGSNRLFVVYADTLNNWLLDVWEPKDNAIWGRFSTQPIPSGGLLGSAQVGGAGIVENPTTQRMFLVNTGDASLSVFDGNSLGEIKRVTLGTDPFALAVDTSRSLVYVGLRASGSLVKLADSD